MAFPDWLFKQDWLMNIGKGIYNFANSASQWEQGVNQTLTENLENHPVTGAPGSSGMDNLGSDVAGVISGDFVGNKNDTDPEGTLGSTDKYDETGFDQAEWQFNKYLELLAEQRAYNSAEAEKTREWQERLSNTAYQRGVEDLEKAGLNKWLAVTGGANGASASTPSGATASSSLGSASVPNPQLQKATIEFLKGILQSFISVFDFF